jgi:hypothetical protein
VTAAAIAADVRAKRRTAREIIVDALSRIRARNAELNAFTQVFERRALERAERIDALLAQDRDPGPLAGVPFAAKNLFDIAGIVTRAGAKVTEGDSPAAHDAEAIAAWERSGAVLVGATNMDEFAYGFVTENAHDGPTHNPHDGGRIAGGSSGGSAAAVGAELVPLALASDTNGSVVARPMAGSRGAALIRSWRASTPWDRWPGPRWICDCRMRHSIHASKLAPQHLRPDARGSADTSTPAFCRKPAGRSIRSAPRSARSPPSTSRTRVKRAKQPS